MGEIIDIKSGAVINAGEQPDPHLTLQTIDGKTHIIPVSCIQDIIDGEIPITQLENWEMICRTILAVFLSQVKK